MGIKPKETLLVMKKGSLKLKEGIDYHKTFSLVSEKDFFIIIMALVAHFNLVFYPLIACENIIGSFLGRTLKSDYLLDIQPN